MTTDSNAAVAQAHVADAIAHLREAMLRAEDRELSHFLQDASPCEAAHTAEDAAVHAALLQSEDAMIHVLQTLPTPPKDAGPLAN